MIIVWGWETKHIGSKYIPVMCNNCPDQHLILSATL
ncbi:hypothetical protein CCPUN_00200 [Cardinium endosymbiont of Culicoides punctatus]|nr:hypothetical protein CCPUN_00200 [Cardinium endosymbiont of Culicoides punctatus]